MLENAPLPALWARPPGPAGARASCWWVPFRTTAESLGIGWCTTWRLTSIISQNAVQAQAVVRIGVMPLQQCLTWDILPDGRAEDAILSRQQLGSRMTMLGESDRKDPQGLSVHACKVDTPLAPAE